MDYLGPVVLEDDALATVGQLGGISIAWSGGVHFTSTVTLTLDYLGDWITRWHLTVSEDLVITLASWSAPHPGRFTLQLKNLSGHAISFGGTNHVVHPGVDLSESPQIVLDLVWDPVASRWRVGNIGGKTSAPAMIQQDSGDLGRTIFVQFTGDPDPVSPVRGDIRIREV